jgi:hypothetical protein
MKLGHYHRKSGRHCSQSKLSCGMGKNIHKSKKQIATQMWVELQHRSVGAYCLSFSSDTILFRIARAFDRGTAARFLAIRNGDTNYLGLFLKQCPRCLNMIFSNPSMSWEPCSRSSGDNRSGGVKQLMSSIGSLGKMDWDTSRLVPTSPVIVL